MLKTLQGFGLMKFDECFYKGKNLVKKFGKNLKIFEIILKESPSKEDFNKLNINFINYLHPVILFTHLRMFFSNPFAYITQEYTKEKEMFVVRVEL